MITTGAWECTDTEQYGREISELTWEYKQPDINNGEVVVVDLNKYTGYQIQDAISTFGV